MTATSNLLPRGWPPDHPIAVKAEGRHVWTADGRRFLDGASGALVVNLGYGVPEVAKAVADQVRSLAFAHSLHFSTEVAEALATELAEVLPGAGDQALSRLLFVTGGTEAIEMALALAYRIQASRGETDRTVFVARHLSYHGASLSALALGGRGALRQLVLPLLGDCPHVPPPYPYRPEWREGFPNAVAEVPGVAECISTALSSQAIDRGRADEAEAVAVAIENLGPERVCAFIAEPIIGASAGAVVPDDAYWPRVRSVCDEHGVLWIADEVMTGMGRTGRWMAAEHWDVVPDIAVLGKGLGCGYVPLAAVALRETHWQTLADAPPGFPLGFTFSHHPVAIAAGRAVLQVLRGRELLPRADRLGAHLKERLQETLGEHPHVGEVRGRGLMLGVELVADRETRTPFPPEWNVTGRTLRAAEDAGILLYPARGSADGVAGDAFLVAPPLTITNEECDELVEGVVTALDALGEAPGRP